MLYKSIIARLFLLFRKKIVNGQVARLPGSWELGSRQQEMLLSLPLFAFMVFTKILHHLILLRSKNLFGRDLGHDPVVPCPRSWFDSFSNHDVIKKNASFSQS